MAVKTSINEIKNIARHMRWKIVEMSYKAKTSHVGSALSCVDILAAVYWSVLNIDPNNPLDKDRDRFILSKGHAATALYTALAFRGFYPEQWLESYATSGSKLEEHPGPRCVPGVEAATGSLGHGLSLGVGMALSAKIKDSPYHSYVLLSDGECNEGTVWEAAMFSSAKNLDNLTAIIDFNKWQATGRSREIMAIEPLWEKWESFGWSAHEVDGHDIDAIVHLLEKLKETSGKPSVIIAHTIKGRGISFMEDDNNWHYRIPDENDLMAVKGELGFI